MEQIEGYGFRGAVFVACSCFDFPVLLFPEEQTERVSLPVYPFVGYFIAVYVRKLAREGKWCVKAYGWIICITGILSGDCGVDCGLNGGIPIGR